MLPTSVLRGTCLYLQQKLEKSQHNCKIDIGTIIQLAMQKNYFNFQIQRIHTTAEISDRLEEIGASSFILSLTYQVHFFSPYFTNYFDFRIFNQANSWYEWWKTFQSHLCLWKFLRIHKLQLWNHVLSTKEDHTFWAPRYVLFFKYKPIERFFLPLPSKNKTTL